MNTALVEPLDLDVYRDLVHRALAEDIGSGDVTTMAIVDPEVKARAILLAKSPCVVAGLDVAFETFRQIDPAVRMTAHHRDGSWCEPGTIVAEFHGNAADLLTAERTALNFMQRLTGIATLSRRLSEAAGERITVLDTRKTTPLLRTLEKYAVRAGGAVNHRFRLDDGILIKDNHVRLAGGVGEAVARMRAYRLKAKATSSGTRSDAGTMPIEVEAQSLEQVDEALAAGADIVLLDNLSTPDIVTAVRKCRGRAKTEISGGVTLQRMPELAATGADFVSVGALTHSAPASDLSFEIEPL